jgi:DNA-binding winged helix-turn-helix (wHTH) protein
VIPGRLAFGDCVLDGEAGTLERAGRRIALGPRILDLIAAFAAHPGRVLTREELRREVWRGEDVSDWALSRAVFEARRAIGDGRPPRIETVRGRGFRWNGDVSAARSAPAPLAGRADARAEIERALARVLSGERTLLLVSGEPGIGKTRLLDEAGRLARERGVRVVASHCPPGPSRELAPWRDVRRSLRESEGPPDARAFRDELPRLVERAAQEAPLLMMLDDLHRISGPSLAVLRRVARSAAPCALVAAWRDAPAGFDTDPCRSLVALGELPDARRIALAGLDDDALALLARELGRAAPADLLDRSGGNPYFARQLLGSAEPSGEPPPGVRTGVEEHLAGLGGAARAFLEACAVLGGAADGERAGSVAGLAPEVARRAREDLLAAGLIEASRGGFRFRHGVVSEALYVALPSERRRELHARAARELLAGVLEPADTEALRRHLAAGRAHLEAGPAVARLRAAGARALELGRRRDAAELLEAALALQCGLPRDDGGLLELLIELGSAQMRAMHLAAGRATLARAAQLARSAGDARALARAALAHLGFEEEPHVEEDRVGPLEEALAALPEADDPLRARAMGALARVLVYDSDAARRASLARDAVAMARRLSDPETLIFALRDLHFAGWDELGPRERRRIAREGVALAAASGDPMLEHEALMEWIADVLEAGDRAALDAALAAHRATRERSRHPVPAWHGAHYETMRALVDGDLAEAERALERGGRLGRETGYPLAVQWQALQIFGLRREQDRLGELLPALREVAGAAPLTPWPIAAALLEVRSGNLEPAWTCLRARVHGDRVRVPGDFSRLAALALLAELCEALGAAEEAAAVERALAPHEDLHVTVYGMLHLGSVEHYLGILAEAAGAPARAAERYARAEVAEARLGARAALRRTRARLTALRERPAFEGTMTSV